MEMRGLRRIAPLITPLGTGLAGPLHKIRSEENETTQPKTPASRVWLTGVQINQVGLLAGASRGNQFPILHGARRCSGADWLFLLAMANKPWYTSCTRKLAVASIFGVTGGAVCP